MRHSCTDANPVIQKACHSSSSFGPISPALCLTDEILAVRNFVRNKYKYNNFV